MSKTDLSISSNALTDFVGTNLGKKGISRLDTDRYAGQCVSLVGRYILEVCLGLKETDRTFEFGDGRFTAKNTAENFREWFHSYKTPSCADSLPRLGAVISFDGKGTTSKYGHTGLVVEIKRDMERKVRILQSNADGKNELSTVTLSDWINIEISDVYGKALGWASPRVKIKGL